MKVSPISLEGTTQMYNLGYEYSGRSRKF